jgi:hypothetical protein
MAVEKTEYTANGATITRYSDTLINGASGVIEMVFIKDDILRAVMIGKFKSNNAANGLILAPFRQAVERRIACYILCWRLERFEIWTDLFRLIMTVRFILWKLKLIWNTHFVFRSQ